MIEKPRTMVSNVSASEPATNRNAAVHDMLSNENAPTETVATSENAPTETVATNENPLTEFNRNAPKNDDSDDDIVTLD